MARRRKRRSNVRRVAIFAIIAIAIVGGGLLFALANEDFDLFSQVFLGDIFNDGTIESSSENFVLPPLALTPFDTVECTARFTMVAVNNFNQVITTINSQSSTSPLFVDLSLIVRGQPSTLANTIKEYQVTPKLKCDNKGGSGGSLGYFLPHPQVISFVTSIKSPNGGGISTGTFSTSRFSHGDLGDNVERFFPTVVIPASVFDNSAPPFSSVYDSEVTIVMGGQLNFEATGFGGFGLVYPYFIGQNAVVVATHQVAIDKVGGAPVEGDQRVNINSARRLSDLKDLLGHQTKINSLAFEPADATVQVVISVPNFRDVNLNEDPPLARIYECGSDCSSNNRLVATARSSVPLGGGDPSTSTSSAWKSDVQVPQGVPAGLYLVEVFSNDRNQVQSRSFLVERVVDPASCGSNQEYVGGQCVDIIEPMCDAGYSGTPPNCVLIDDTCPEGTSGTKPNCVPDTTCEDQGQVTQSDGTCADEDTGGTPEPEPEPEVTGAKGKIEYTAHFSTTSDVTNRDCTDAGTIPTDGVSVVNPLQLISGVGTCGGNLFTDVEIRPILDFSGLTSQVAVDKNSIEIDADIWVSTNNPFPANPMWENTCPISPPDLPSNCNLSNHDFGLNTKKSSFEAGENVPVGQFRSGSSTIYDLALIKIDANSLERKIAGAGLTLKDGDEYSFMIQVLGKFTGTVGTEQVTGVIPPIAYHHTLNYKEIGGTCDLTVSFLDETCVVINETTGEQQCTEQCKPREPDKCPNGQVRDPQTNTCEPMKPPTDPCPPTQIESPVGSGNCITPEKTQCEPVPVCTATEKLDNTGVNDDCGFAILQCVPKVTTPVNGCENGLVPDTSTGACVEPKPKVIPPVNGACPPEYVLNTFGNCQLIGSGGTGDGGAGGGGSGDINFCALDSNFSLAQCFAQIFNPEGDQEGFMITGATQTAVIVAGMVIVLLVVVAVVIRIRRGGGFGS